MFDPCMWQGHIILTLYFSLPLQDLFAARPLLSIVHNREVKHDIYRKWQTAKLKLLPSLFSCVYSRVKLFVFAMKSRRWYSIFVYFIFYSLEEKNSKSEVIFAVCHLLLTSCLTSLMLLLVTYHCHMLPPCGLT